MIKRVNQNFKSKSFKEFQKLIYAMAGINLADSKVVIVQGRLAKRLRALQLDSYGEYLRFLKSGESHDEQTHFINCLTTNKTDFFRESHHFDFLKNVVFFSCRKTRRSHRRSNNPYLELCKFNRRGAIQHRHVCGRTFRSTFWLGDQNPGHGHRHECSRNSCRSDL